VRALAPAHCSILLRTTEYCHGAWSRKERVWDRKGSGTGKGLGQEQFGGRAPDAQQRVKQNTQGRVRYMNGDGRVLGRGGGGDVEVVNDRAAHPVLLSAHLPWHIRTRFRVWARQV